jgi:hypothetical protein
MGTATTKKLSNLTSIPSKYRLGLRFMVMERLVQLDGLVPVMYEELLPLVEAHWYLFTQENAELEGMVGIGDLVITSAREGGHSKKDSRHYIGLAVDFRINHLPGDMPYRWCASLQNYLGPRWKVLLSNNCLHVQYQGYVIPSGR